MSALGQKRTLKRLHPMSALPPKADILECDRHVRFVPKADIGLNYSPAVAANVSMTAIFASRFDGRPCRSFRYSGLLYASQTFP
jgi:hypothetical protein